MVIRGEIFNCFFEFFIINSIIWFTGQTVIINVAEKNNQNNVIKTYDTQDQNTNPVKSELHPNKDSVEALFTVQAHQFLSSKLQIFSSMITKHFTPKILSAPLINFDGTLICNVMNEPPEQLLYQPEDQ